MHPSLMFATFVLFGPTHLAAIGVIVGTMVVLPLIVRFAPNGETAARMIAVWLAVALLVNKLLVYNTIYSLGEFNLRDDLPMHLCDWSGIAAIIALVFRKQLAFELAFFWGLGGTLQATITPDLHYDYPDMRFITFFVSHGGTLVAIAFLVFGMRMRPYPISLLRIFLWSNIYLLAAGTVDYLLNENYGYLQHKPMAASLLDYLGPWPYYILSLEGIALVSYLVYYAPFFVVDVVRRMSRGRGV